MEEKTKIVKIRWNDGFCRTLECVDYQFGGENYWFKLVDGREKWVPISRIRSVTVFA